MRGERKYEHKRFERNAPQPECGPADDVERLKAAGYYEEAIARIDAYLAEDWTMTQNSPYSQGLCPHMDVQPREPHPPRGGRSAGRYDRPAGDHAADPGGVHLEQGGGHCRDAAPVKDFTPEEFEMLDRENRMDWRFVEGERQYQNRFASTLHRHPCGPCPAADRPPAQPDSEKERCRRLHEKMAEQGSASARITLKASVGMSDEAFAAALANGQS